jgi:hypothetical protein
MSDINKVKRIKFHKRIREIIQTVDKVSIVVYEDGSCESLQSALDSRKEQKENSMASRDFFIEIPSISSSGIFNYIKKVKDERYLCYTYIDSADGHKPIGELQTFPIERRGTSARLIGSTVVTSDSESSFISIWSDKRIFSTALKMEQGSSNNFLSPIEIVSGKKDLFVAPISDKCIVIYAASDEEDSSSLIIYNLRYKVIQSRIPFKVFMPYTRFWVINNHIFLALGQYLKAIPFLLGEDKLSAMIGSQRSSAEMTVENEMLNEDVFYEQGLEFDENQEPVEGMEFIPNNQFWKHQKKILSGAKAVTSGEEVRSQLNELYRGDIIVELVKSNDLPIDAVAAKLLSNVDEPAFMLSESVEYYCSELERVGYSEIDITNKIVPVLIKANRSEDIGLLLKRYSNISERMLVNIIKYILQCPCDTTNEEVMEVDDQDENGVSLTKEDLCAKKKFGNKNAFLNTKQDDKRDVLTIALCCAFDSTTILPHVRSQISLPEMVQLMDHLYKILTTSLLNDRYEMRGNLVEGDDFDLDTKLFEWFRLLLDSHYQQILWSRDKELEEKLMQWLSLVDSHIGILSEMKSLRPVVSKIAQNKTLQLSKKCNQWYTVEKLKLY